MRTLVAVIAWITVFIVTLLILDWLLPEAQKHRRQRSLSVLPIATMTPNDDAFIWVFVVFAVIVGYLTVTGLWALCASQWPKISRRIGRVLPMACDHLDEHGRSNTYRERRQLHGVDVLFLICYDCGTAKPMQDLTADEHRLHVASGAVRKPHAHPKEESTPKLRQVVGGRS